MNSTKPITLFRGDDTDAFGLRTITIKLSGDLSLTNATAKFAILGYTKTWTNLETRTGSLTLVFTAADTRAMPLGAAFGKLWLYDIEGAAEGSVGKRLTVCNTIPFEIINRVEGAPEEEYSIHVTLAVDTEIDIEFKITGGSGGEAQWAKSPSNSYLYPTDNRVQKIIVPALESVASLGSRYTLADVKNLVNTILAALKN